MASPFSIFRKNQRVWMAGAVFIAIVAFVISPMIGYFSDASRMTRTGSKRTVASWNGGSIRQDQLEREFDQLQKANMFLRKLAIDVRDKGGNPNVPEFNPDLSLLGITSDMDSYERILERKLLSAEAKRLGIVFDDQSVKTFLQRFVDGKLNGEQIQKALFTATDGRLSWFDFNRLMQEELAKNEVLRIAGAGLRFEDRRESRTLGRPALTTPGKNWQDFLRFNRGAKIQAFPVFAKDFEDQVKGSPTEKEVQELYKEGKDLTRTSRTIATQPAFMRPKTANFEFVSIDVEKIIVEQMKLIPEDTLRAEYDRRVADKQFRVPVTPEATGTPVEPADGAKPAEGTAPADAEKPAEGAMPAEGTVPAEGAKEKPEVPAEQPAAPEAKPADAPAEGTEPPAAPPALPDPNANLLRKRNDAIKLVSYQESTGEKAPEAAPPQEKAAEPTATEPAAPATPATDPVPAAAPATTPSVEISDAPVAAQTPAGSPDIAIADATPMRTKTFEEVKDQLAREQAQGIAYKIVDERIALIFNPMSIYQSELRGYEQAKAEKAPDAKAPQRPDLEKLAKENGFEFGTTGLIDADTAQLSPIGSSFIMRVGPRQQPIPFVALIGESTGLAETFTPGTSIGFTGGNQRFVFWKTEEILPVTPSLESVRDQINVVWKKQQAFKLAQARAGEIAQKVGGGSLKESLATPSDQALVLEPPSFTWFNPMFARMESRMQLSNVELLQPVDDSFMEAVFACAPGKTTVASDANKTVYYAIQVAEMSPDNASLLERFAASPLEGVSTVSRIESDRALQPWFQNLQKQLGFRVD